MTFAGYPEVFNIRRVCKQLRHETEVLPWRCSRYVVADRKLFLKWVGGRRGEVRMVVGAAVREQCRGKDWRRWDRALKELEMEGERGGRSSKA